MLEMKRRVCYSSFSLFNVLFVASFATDILLGMLAQGGHLHRIVLFSWLSVFVGV